MFTTLILCVATYALRILEQNKLDNKRQSLLSLNLTLVPFHLTYMTAFFLAGPTMAVVIANLGVLQVSKKMQDSGWIRKPIEWPTIGN